MNAKQYFYSQGQRAASMNIRGYERAMIFLLRTTNIPLWAEVQFLRGYGDQRGYWKV